MDPLGGPMGPWDRWDLGLKDPRYFLRGYFLRILLSIPGPARPGPAWPGPLSLQLSLLPVESAVESPGSSVFVFVSRTLPGPARRGEDFPLVGTHLRASLR